MLTHLEVEDRTAPATWDNPGRDHARHPSRRCCCAARAGADGMAERDAERAENGRPNGSRHCRRSRRIGSEGGEMLGFAHIPTGTAINLSTMDWISMK
jgi:hypothetical protein